jgi:biopolymer transport protein ExbD
MNSFHIIELSKDGLVSYDTLYTLEEAKNMLRAVRKAYPDKSFDIFLSASKYETATSVNDDIQELDVSSITILDPFLCYQRAKYGSSLLAKQRGKV